MFFVASAEAGGEHGATLYVMMTGKKCWRQHGNKDTAQQSSGGAGLGVWVAKDRESDIDNRAIAKETKSFAQLWLCITRPFLCLPRKNQMQRKCTVWEINFVTEWAV